VYVALRSKTPTKRSKTERNPINGDHDAAALEVEAPVDKLAIKYPRVQSIDHPDICRVT
jgi:hypothetical protein